MLHVVDMQGEKHSFPFDDGIAELDGAYWLFKNKEGQVVFAFYNPLSWWVEQ